MDTIDRRTMLRCILRGTAIAAVGVAVIPSAVEAVPIALEKSPAGLPDELVEQAQWGRRRRWVCTWHRGRRVCGWRWVRW